VSSVSQMLFSIQALRGLAAVMVVLFHASSFEIGSAGVDIFFVISGFIMLHTNRDDFGRAGAPVLFFKRRIARIVPLYWLFTVAVYRPKLVTLSTLVGSLFFVPVRNPDGLMRTVLQSGWTLDFEMFFYVVFAVALWQPRKLGLPLIFAALSCFVLLGITIKPSQAAFIYWTNPLLLEFMFGLAIALLYQHGIRLSSALGLGLIAVGALVLAAFQLTGYPTPNRVYAGDLAILWGAPAAIIVGGAALSDSGKPANGCWRPAQILGDASYSIYLSHLITLGLLRRLVGDLPHFGVVYSLAAVLAGVGVHFFIERPMGKYLTRWFSTKEVWPRASLLPQARAYDKP
jgi:exopolysaccharide production protein ExoZ